MPILYAVVARGTTILAKYASCAGNFAEVVELVLGKISPENAKLTYTHGSYLFHYISDNRIIYMCISSDDFERSKAFAFLGEIQRKFNTQFGTRAQTALPYSMNSEFARVLSNEMRFYNSERSSPPDAPDKMRQVENQVDELKGIMVRNIDQLATRGERLELLVDKTEDLNAHSVTFKKQSATLRRSLWWKNVKLIIVIAIVVIILLYIIISISCGGLAWQKCVKH